VSEDKFTPGPWEADELDVFAPSDCPYHPVADCTSNSSCRDYDTDEANARLIAAAPELLEALRDLMDIETCDIGMDDFEDSDSVGAYQDGDGQTKDLPLTFGHLRRARAAIAKATGEQTRINAD
jgi:hypothetical protein